MIYYGAEDENHSDAILGQYGVELAYDNLIVGYLLLQDTECGWDYTLLAPNCTEIDGGVYEESEQALTVLDVIKDLAESMEYCQLLVEVPNEYAFVDYDELWEEYENNDICRNRE